jgi:hypothetical protein
MAFDITELTAAINRRGGVAKPNLFYVQITPPKNLMYASYSREVPFFCSDAVLPGLVLNTSPFKPGGYGTSVSRPTELNFNEVTMTFMVDNDAKVLDYFQKWMTLIHNFSVDQGGLQQGSKLAYGEFGYPETYEAANIQIFFLNNAGDEIITYSLSNAFPIQIGSIMTGWEMNDTMARVSITFAYNNWDTEAIPASEMDSEEAMRIQSTQQGRFNFGAAYMYGLNLLQNGRRSPLGILSGVTAFATTLR